MESRRVLVGGDTLSVAVRKGTPTVLLLHGLAGHGAEWSAVVDCLDSSIGVINPDQRAHGRSWQLGAVNVDRSNYVSNAADLVEQFAVGPIVAVGHSMGGIVATLLAHKRPDLVSQLVLIECGMSAMDADQLAGLEAWFGTWPEVFADEVEALEFFGSDTPATRAWIQGLRADSGGLRRRFEPAAMVETMRQLAATSRWREWSEIDVPMTLIRASLSSLSDSDVNWMLSRRPSTRMVLVDGSGHDVHLDRPEKVAAVLRGSLGACS